MWNARGVSVAQGGGPRATAHRKGSRHGVAAVGPIGVPGGRAFGDGVQIVRHTDDPWGADRPGEAGGAVFAAAGAWCGREWTRSGGPVVGSVMSALYTGAMGGSHPLAKKVGAWKSVVAVTAVTVVASEVVTRRG